LHKASCPRQTGGDERSAHDLNVSKREIMLVEAESNVKIHGLETNWRPLESNMRIFASA